MKPFREDGQAFIRTATRDILSTNSYADVSPKISRTQQKALSRSRSPVSIMAPKTFSHYVLNLPASAITFLPAFIGIYADHSGLFEPYQSRELPLVHVHCFSTKSDDNKEEERKICEEISKRLEFDMRPGNLENEGEAEIWDVRDVAPLKRMFCASFRLPKAVAFRETQDPAEA